LALPDRLKVLVVDDNTYAREITIAMLEKLGVAEVAQASGGADALAAVLTDTPSVVVMDWYMPDVSGAGLLQMIRDRRIAPPGIKVVLMTAYASRENIARARELGIDEVLIKPFSSEQMSIALRKVMPNQWQTAPTRKVAGGGAEEEDDQIFL
jgi:two-component system, chemotaxis family, chemotaxis protein CheY